MGFPRSFSKVFLSLMWISFPFPPAATLIPGEVGTDSDLWDFSSNPEERLMVVVSNLDGSVSTLNGRTGDLHWFMPTGVRPLLSSSISNIQMTRNGLPSRLVPSLDGGLYQMDGEGIEPIPLAADLLLTSTYKLTDESSIVGGKEIETYGVDMATGNLRYICSSASCRTMTGLEKEGAVGGADETLVIKRTDRTIRLVDVIDGQEKWNFSVGKLDVSYHVRSDAYNTIEGSTSYDDDQYMSGDDYTGDFHPRFTGDKFDLDDIDLKVKVPTGVVLAVSRNNPSHVYWEHQFTTSIAGVWVMRGRILSPISLFDDRNIASSLPFHSENEQYGPKLMYIGAYNDMLYVQPSDIIRGQQVTTGDKAAFYDNETPANQVQVYMPRVRWKPYIASAPSRTPIILNHKLARKEFDVDSAALPPASPPKDKSLIVPTRNQYPFDGGYYLYLDYTPIEDFSYYDNKTHPRRSLRMEFVNVLATRWKELTFFLFIGMASLVSSVRKLFDKHRRKADPSLESIPSYVSRSCSAQFDLPETLPYCQVEKVNEVEPECQIQQFVSRYLTDFQQQECLGRGGFGVVFKALNVIDEYSYAVKRIALKDSKTARDKVMREVKALAKLDHPGIVRYYQSWFECPPPGWQEERDKIFFSGQSSSAVAISLETDPVVTSVTTSRVQRSKVPRVEGSKGVKRDKSMNESSGLIIFDAHYCPDGDDDHHNVKVNIGLSSNDDDDGSSRNDDDDDDNVEEEETSRNRPIISQSDESTSIIFEGSNKYGPAIGRSLGESVRRRNVVNSNDSSILFKEGSNYIPSSKISANHMPTNDNQLNNGDIIKNSKQGENSDPEGGKREHPEEGKRAHPRKLFLYIQMQLCRPESLREWIIDTPFDIESSYDVFYQILSAICYVHSQALMHRDLKPSNIFFAMDGTVKVGDFGLVTAVEKICDDDNNNTNNNNDAGDGNRADGNHGDGNRSDGYFLEGTKKCKEKKHTNQVGTHLYMSPEQSSGHNYTHKVDIYALGVIFFEMFQRFSTHMERVKSLQLIRDLKFPFSFVDNFKDEHEFVKPLLSHDPSERPDTRDLLRHELLVAHEESSNLFRRLHRVRTVSSNSSSSPSPTL